MDLGRVGIWSTELRYGDPGEIRDTAELEEPGWPALWVPSVLGEGVLTTPEGDVIMDAVEMLTTTRSVRRRLDLDRLVEPEVLTECLRIAQQAPAAGALASNFRWLVVRDPQLRAKIAEPIRELGRISQEKYQHFVADRRLSSARYLLDVAHRVPVFILACMHGKPGESNGERSAFYGSAYPAIWSLQLALRSRGLGSTLVLYHLMGAEEQVASILGIPDDVTQIALLAVGYTTTAEFHPARRPPIEEITYYDHWGQAGEPPLA